MDKYEYKLRADEIKNLIKEGRYAEAVQIADSIDWKKVKSVRMLCTISDIYKINRRYEEARDILLLANAQYPEGRYIIYSLCELSIILGDIVQAVEYNKAFVRVAPHNTSRYILQYKLYVAQNVSIEERIAVLKEFKKHDYREKWGYELAFLYHRVGLATECVEECDELFTWFSGGSYVMKALELKKKHATLTQEQQRVYDRYMAGLGITPEEQPKENYDNDHDEMGHDESAEQQESNDGEFHVKTVDVGQYNTINLQQVIADSLKELQRKPEAVSQSTKVMGEKAGAGGKQEAKSPEASALSAGDTGVLGITEEDLEQYEEENTPSAPSAPVVDNKPGEKTMQFTENLNRVAASIASDDTIYMPGIPQMAAYAAERDIEIPQQEISARTIAQATGEIPMTAPAERVQEPPLENPVQEALRRPPVPTAAQSEPMIPIPQENPERQLEAALGREVRRAESDARRLRAEERRAELKSREKDGRKRGVSSDTRRMGQTREYTPMASRMDRAVEAAIGDGPGNAMGHVPSPIPREEILTSGASDMSSPRVIYPSNKQESGYDSLLSQGPDGQISMAVDEQTILERQITGQISINDFLTDWEDYKKDQQKRQISEIREHVRQNTDELFKNYDEKRQLERAAMEADAVPEEPEEKEPERKPTREEIAHQLAILEGKIPPEAPAEAPTSAEDEHAIRMAEGDATQPMPDAESVEEAMQTVAEERVPLPTTRPIANLPWETVQEEDGTDAEEAETDEEEAPEEYDGEPVEETAEEEDEPAEESEASEEEQEEAGEEDRLPDEEAADTDEEEPEDTAEEAESAASGTESGQAEPQEGGEEAGEEDVLRVMTPEEKELFGPYIHKKRSREQIINAIDSLSMAAYAGNAIITGEEGAGTINLAKGLIRSVQLSDSNFAGQIAKISGRAMNRKRVDAIISKLSGGALIIQGASGMNNETTKALLAALQSENTGIIVILEDTRKGIGKYLKKHPEITECFNVRVDVEALATRELVAYAKQYARDREYSMDEFAVLALHKRIDEMQTAEHEVTIAEVREIVEDAIHRANRKNPGHFFDILLQKRYDGEDMIVLREKDFLR